jgi:hypothetical protein
MEDPNQYSSWLGIAALLIVVVRECILLTANLTKRRNGNAAGEQSRDYWLLEIRHIVDNSLEDKLNTVHNKLDELVRKDRTRIRRR